MSSGSPSGRSTRPRRFEDERELRRTSVRIGLQTGGLLLAVLAIVSALVLLVVIGTQQTQIRSVLDQAIAVTHGDGGHRPDDDDAEVRDVVVAVSDPYGLRTDASMPTGLPDRAVMAQVSRTGVTDERRLTLNGVHYVVRTAKHGVTKNTDNWKKKTVKYKATKNVATVLEVLFGMYFVFTIGLAAYTGSWMSIPFLVLFMVGFLYVGLLSLYQAR